MRTRLALDSSVLIAILNGEHEGGDLLQVLADGQPVIGAPTVLEARLWCLRRLDSLSSALLDDLLADHDTDVVAFDAELERIAASAYARFGKGRHPAALNFGDAMSYAVAARHQLPLLFKGGDFG